MFVHTVYFWLDRSLSHERVAAFEAGLRSLLGIATVRHGFVGRPAATARPVVDRTYDYALTVVFDDLPGHDVYQAHPLHRAFVDTQAPCWIKVLIYDAE